MLQKDMNYNKKTEGRGGCLNTGYHKTVHPFRNSGPVHTYPDIFNPLFFLSGFGFESSTSIRWNWHTDPQLFESALHNVNFWIHYEPGIVWTLNSNMPRSVVPWIYSVNIVFQMTTSTHAQFPILPEESWVTEIIRIFVGYVWTGKFDLNADTCGKTKGRKKWEIQLGSELALFLSFLLSIASNILSSCFHFSWVDHVVYEGHNYHS